MTWRNRQLFKNSCGNLILPNSPLLSYRYGGHQVGKSISEQKGKKYFFYSVLHEQKVYSQKFFISSYKTHSSALWEYVRKEEDKRQNGQNWCATLFPVGSLSQFMMEHPCRRGCRVRGHLFALYWISTFHFIRYFVLIYTNSTITK